METVTVVLAPGASVPDAELRVTQLWVLTAVQSMEVTPPFVRVYSREEGENGPP